MQYNIESLLSGKGIVIKACMPKAGIAPILEKMGELNRNGTVVQAFDSSAIINKEHLLFAYANASIAKAEKRNRASSAALEMLCFAALTMQISDAIRICGAKEGSKMVIFSNSRAAYKKIEGMLSSVGEFRRSDGALERLGALSFEDVLQKMALLNISD
ncbi:MAG: KEOPS complex subunit Cgi121 [Candidatus Micrarchaeaceae archaeon]